MDGIAGAAGTDIDIPRNTRGLLTSCSSDGKKVPPPFFLKNWHRLQLHVIIAGNMVLLSLSESDVVLCEKRTRLAPVMTERSIV